MPSLLIGFCVALGIGLLVGAERERRKGRGSQRQAAGIRTFTVAALLGAVSMVIGQHELLALAVLLVGLSAIIAYQKSHSKDPGLTTELALILTCALGGLAIEHSMQAAAIGVLLALLLAARNRIHHFVNHLLTEQDIHDALLFSAIALIALPLAPDRYMGPFDAINPRNLLSLILVVMAISATGYIGTRWLGPRYGLPLAGFASGFVSSTATIHSMGQLANSQNGVILPAVAGAALSSIATILQMAILIGLVAPSLLLTMSLPLLSGGICATLYGLIFLLRCTKTAGVEPPPTQGRAFNLGTSVAFTLLLSTVVLISAALNAWMSEQGIVLSALVAGLADAHATAASTASLMASEKISSDIAILAILLGLTTNTLTKAIVAVHAGGFAFAQKIIPGLALMMLAVWAGYWVAL